MVTELKNPEDMVARWLQRFSPYDFTITHMAGKIHKNADGLSRQRCRPCKRPGCSDCKLIRKNGNPVAPLPEESMEEDEDIGFRCLFGSTSVDPVMPSPRDLSKGESLLTPVPSADHRDVPEASCNVPEASRDVPEASHDVPEASRDVQKASRDGKDTKKSAK